MLTSERHEVILNLLADKQTIKIQEIVDATSASESTIRRDLTELEEQQKLERVFGGARVMERNLPEASIRDKATKNLQEKKRIAELAATLIQQGDCIFLDAGTTTFEMIPLLAEKEVVVVTNGLTHIEPLMENGVTSYLTGGFIKARTSALVGPQTIQSMENYRFDKCFLGVNGFHPESGYTTPDPEEAAVKQLASSLSRTSYVLADHTKYNKVSFAKIMDLDQAALVVDDLQQQEIALIEKKTTVKVGKG